MARSERSGALVDVPAASLDRGGRLTTLAKRGGRFALAYLVFEVASTSPLIAFVLATSHAWGGSPIRAALNAGIAFLALTVPIAWVPLSLSFYLSLKARSRAAVACLVAGTATGLVLAMLCAILFAWLGTLSLDTSPPSHDSTSWLDIARQLPEGLAICAPGGVLGGFVLWVLFFWRPSRIEPATHQLGEA